MLYNNIPFTVIEHKVFFSILQGGLWMRKTMQTFSVTFQMPVIQKKIMQQSSADHTFVIHVQSGFSAKPKADIGNRKTMLKTGYLCMLDKSAHGLDIFRLQQFFDAIRKKKFLFFYQYERIPPYCKQTKSRPDTGN